MKGDEKVRLTLGRWTDVAKKINPQELKSVTLGHVNVGKCCKELFTVLSQCAKCTSLILDYVMDCTDDNRDLAHYLSITMKHLTGLIAISLTNTNLMSGWGKVLSSISSCQIRVLFLIGKDLGGQGKVLRELLTRLKQLRFLELINSGLEGQEMLDVLEQLPISCPLLEGLDVAGHELNEAGDKLVHAVTRLPKLRVLNIENCHLQGTITSNILQQISKDIVVLSISLNQLVPDTPASIFNHIKQCKSLQYLKVSSSQFKETAQLNSILSEHGGHLLVDATNEHKECENLNKQMTKILEECLYE